MSTKRNIIIIAVAAVLIIAAGFFAVNAFMPKQVSISDALSLGERYLSEQKYEQAIIEFDRVLEIEPLNVDAWLGKAEAYVQLGDIAKAIEVLEKAYAITGDERIKARLDELSPQTVETSAAETTAPEVISLETTTEVEEESDPGINIMQTEFSFLQGAGDGMYIAGKGDNYVFVNANGDELSEEFKTFYSCEGTEESNVRFVVDQNDKYCVANQNGEVLLRINSLPEKFGMSLIYKDEPLLLVKNSSGYESNGTAYILVYNMNGEIVYKWYDNARVDGSGKSVTVDMAENGYSDLDYVWVQAVNNYFISSSMGSNSDFYFRFCNTPEYGEDTAKRNYRKYAKEDARDEYDQYYCLSTQGTYYNTSSRNSSGFGGIGKESLYVLREENGKVSLEECEQFEYFRDEKGVVLQPKRMSSMNPDDTYYIKNADGEGYAAKIYSSNGTKCSGVSYFLTSDIIVCRRIAENGEDSEYALFRPKLYQPENGEDISLFEQKVSEKGDSEWEQLSEWYSYLSSERGEKYILVQKADKWGYIDHSGNECALFDDASSFLNGYAFVVNDGKGHIINTDFEAVTEDIEAQSSRAAGKNVFLVNNNGKYSIISLEELKSVEKRESKAVELSVEPEYKPDDESDYIVFEIDHGLYTSTLRVERDLQKLDLHGGSFSGNALEKIGQMTNLTELNLENTKITNISFLKNLKNLKKLNISGNNISDLSPLENLTNLEYLYINNNDVKDISALSKLKNLKELFLSGNKIKSVSELKNLIKLNVLYIDNNKISDISCLEKLTELREFNISNVFSGEITNAVGNAISDISVVKNMKKLETLYAYYLPYTDTSAIKKLKNLEVLYAFGGAIDARSIESIKSKLPKCSVNSREKE